MPGHGDDIALMSAPQSYKTYAISTNFVILFYTTYTQVTGTKVTGTKVTGVTFALNTILPFILLPKKSIELNLTSAVNKSRTGNTFEQQYTSYSVTHYLELRDILRLKEKRTYEQFLLSQHINRLHSIRHSETQPHQEVECLHLIENQ